MSKKLEIEKKYLVKPPTSWVALSEMFEDLIDIKRISQTYLIAKKGEQSARVRKTIEGLIGETGVIYHYNKKNPVGSGVHEEIEREINKSEYEKYLKEAHPDKSEVEKTRFVFKYDNHPLELDIFKGALKGLAILEIELENKKDKVKLPPFLKVIKEVTDDKKYTNFALADKKYHKSDNSIR